MIHENLPDDEGGQQENPASISGWKHPKFARPPIYARPGQITRPLEQRVGIPLENKEAQEEFDRLYNIKPKDMPDDLNKKLNEVGHRDTEARTNTIAQYAMEITSEDAQNKQ